MTDSVVTDGVVSDSAVPHDLPLDGIRVVAVEQAVAVPFATRQLADLGARVTKVERPDGGDFARGYDTKVNGLAAHFVWLNRSKESVALDLKNPDGRAVLDRLIADADVVVQNLGPGAAARLGIDAATLHAADERLVAVDLSGYGHDGPYAAKRAYDLLVQAEAGYVSVTGTPEHAAKSGIPIADIAAGMYVYSSVLAALFRRERTGAGTALHITMLEALAEWMGHPLYTGMYSGEQPPRTGTAHPVIVPYERYPSADGEVLIGVQNDREWVRLCEQVLNRPDLAEHPDYARNTDRVGVREQVDGVVAEATSALSTAELTARLDEAGIANGVANDIAGLIEHPQLAHRERWGSVGSPVGDLRVLRPPAFDARLDPIPALGEHTDAVLARCGYAPAEIAGLRASGAVG